MFDSILVVCIGNICRSPTGERLLRQSLPGKKIDSAGLGALVGEGANEMAADVAAEHGLSLEGHCAQAFSSSLAMQYDLILVMDQGRIVERGSHAQLLAQGGHYARLHAKQFEEGGEAVAAELDT